MSEPTMRLQFFMKSGNSFVVDAVEEFEYTASLSGIKKIKLRQARSPEHAELFVPAMDLDQVEAIVRLPHLPSSASDTETQAQT